MAKKLDTERQSERSFLFSMEHPGRGYLQQQLHINFMSAEQKIAIASITRFLDRKQTRLANGRRVTTPTDAVRCLLEMAYAQAIEDEVFTPEILDDAKRNKRIND